MKKEAPAMGASFFLDPIPSSARAAGTFSHWEKRCAIKGVILPSINPVSTEVTEA